MGLHRIYGVTQPYPSTAVGQLDAAQTADVMYAAHISYPPQRLLRYGHTDWRWNTLTFGTTIATPTTGPTIAATTPNVTSIQYQPYTYLYTDLTNGSPAQETRGSPTGTVSNDLSLSGNYNTITLPAMPTGVTRRVLYRFQAGAYGYIGNTDQLSFRDQNIIPILSETPPEGYSPFLSAGNYPSSVALHQQRLTFGGTLNNINGIFMSRSADLENMDRSRPLRADDSLQFRLVAEQVNAVTNIVSLDQLQVFTQDGIWSIAGANGTGAITASDILPKRQSGRGARRVKPMAVDNIIFFSPAKGRTFRALGYSFEIEGYKSNNVAIFSPHLFKIPIVKMAFQDEPYACVWGVRADGSLLCFTWEQDQQVWGWTLCQTAGKVLDVATIVEGGLDRVYLLVERVIAGVTRRFVERMALPHDNIGSACHLDCAITQIFSTRQNVIGMLWALEGHTVSAVFDGEDGDIYAVHDLVVTGGQVTLPMGWTGLTVSVGLRYYGLIETLPAALTSSQGSAHVNRQQIGSVIVRTIDTKEIEVGASGTPLEMVEPFDSDVDMTTIPDRTTVDYKVVPAGDWKDTSTIIIQQNNPFPTHVVALFPDVPVSDA